MASRSPLLALALPLVLAAGAALAQSRGAAEAEPYEVPGGDIFGFSSPTDIGEKGAKGVALESSTRIGKRGGSYASPTLKTQFGATLSDDFAVALSPFVTGHRIRAAPDLDDRSQVRFDGFSGEASWRFLARSATNPIAMTVSIEPRYGRVDALSGDRIVSHGAEAKLFVDAVLVKDTLYGALNLNYAFGTQRSVVPFDPAWQDGSGTNLSGALTYQVSKDLFVGLEARYLTAFSGATLDQFAGHALLFGPNLLYNLPDGKSSFNIAWTPQIAGRAVGAGGRPLDLDNFERHQLRVKFSTSF